MTRPVRERLYEKAKKNHKTGCLEWTAALDGKGYGQIHFDGRRHRAHRIAFMLERGQIPNKMLVLHKCDNRRCINVEHLFLGDFVDNAVDMVAKGRQVKNPLYGADHPMSKLSPEKVLEIRKIYSSERVTQLALAEQYGVSQSQISYIIRKESWSGLHGEFNGI